MSEHTTSVKTYILVFAALMVLTAITVGVAQIDLGPFNTLAALLIAACKATLVVLIFMHVRSSPRIIGLTIFAGLIWLAILIGLLMTDYMSRGWIPDPKGF